MLLLLMLLLLLLVTKPLISISIAGTGYIVLPGQLLLLLPLWANTH
jgi:hypothetical protein